MSRAEGQRQLAAIGSTDMVGYATMAQKNESQALEFLDEQRRILRSVLPQFDGKEIKTIGDGFLLEFASALQAARCAVEIQDAIQRRNSSLPSEKQIHLRIGINVGDVLRSGGDIVGDGVNIASRSEPLASPGEIYISRQVYDQVQNKLEQLMAPVGTRRLKHIETPVEIYEIAIPGKATSAPQPSEKHRIAVLPVENISRDTTDDYFADGMTEELISTLSRITGLRVIARTSVMRYKVPSKPIAEIGRELGVESIVEGSVRKSGDKIRITAKLVDTRSEEPLWSQEYDREFRDVFSIQSDIAERIAAALKFQVMKDERQGIERRATDNLDAYTSYLKGRYFWNRRTYEGLEKAIDSFEDAVRREPTYALSYAGLADSYAMLALFEFLPPKEAYPKAKRAAQKALEIDDRLGEVHASLGLVKYQFDWDWPGAEAEFRRAIELNPSYAPSHQFFADYLKAMGRFDEALAEMDRAHELDPLSLSINTGVGHVLYLSREYDKAIEQYRRTIELDPNFLQARLWFGRPYLQKGMFREAIAELQQAVSLSGGSVISLAMLGHARAAAGERKEALQILKELRAGSEKQYVTAYWIAVIYNGLHDDEQVFAWLERAYRERSSWLVWMKSEPRFDWLRSDRRFVSLLKRMKLA